jgi:hypothetical protein
MLDLTMRLVVAYGLIVLLLLAGVALVWVTARKRQRRWGARAFPFRERSRAGLGASTGTPLAKIQSLPGDQGLY